MKAKTKHSKCAVFFSFQKHKSCSQILFRTNLYKLYTTAGTSWWSANAKLRRWLFPPTTKHKTLANKAPSKSTSTKPLPKVSLKKQIQDCNGYCRRNIMIMRQKANSHIIWANYKSFLSGYPTMPQLTSANCTPTHHIGLHTKTHGHTHTHTQTGTKNSISPSASSLDSLSLLPFNTPPSQSNPPFKRMPSSPPPNSNLLFQPNSAAQSSVLFSPQVPQQTLAHFFSTFQNLLSKQTNRLFHHHLLPSSSATHTWDLFYLLMWTCQGSWDAKKKFLHKGKGNKQEILV